MCVCECVKLEFKRVLKTITLWRGVQHRDWVMNYWSGSLVWMKCWKCPLPRSTLDVPCERLSTLCAVSWFSFDKYYLKLFLKQNSEKRLCCDRLSLLWTTPLKQSVSFLPPFCLLLPWPFCSNRIKTTSSCNTTFSDHLWGFHSFKPFLFRDTVLSVEEWTAISTDAFQQQYLSCMFQATVPAKKGWGGLWNTHKTWKSPHASREKSAGTEGKVTGSRRHQASC